MLDTNISLASHHGSVVQIELDVAAITAEALRASVQGATMLHECLQQQPWTLQFKVHTVQSRQRLRLVVAMVILVCKCRRRFITACG